MSMLGRSASLRASSIAPRSVRRYSVTAWRRATTTSSVAPVCQRIPTRALEKSGSGSRVTSATRVRNSRLRSRGEVVGACHRAATSPVRASSSARDGQRRGGNLRGGEGLFGLGEGHEALLPADFEAAGDQAVLGLAGMEGPLGSLGFVAGALDRQLGGPAPPATAVGHLVGGGQGQRHLLGAEGRKEPLGHRLVDGGGS